MDRSLSGGAAAPRAGAARMRAVMALVIAGAALAGLGASSARAGPSLEQLVAREQARAAGCCEGLSRLMPVPGWVLAAGGAEPDTPQLVAEEFAGEAGVRLQGEPIVHGPWRLRIAWRDGRAQPFHFEGSELRLALGDEAAAHGGGFGELYASVQRRHWGPGWMGSIILDGAAPALPAVGWRRAHVSRSTSPWLAWLGPWGADVFAGMLQGHEVPRRPFLIGMRLQLAPLERLEIGLSRTMQWGGRGRDESRRSLINALLGRDNVGFDGITSENEPGNQLAGIDMRWRLDAPQPMSIYAQVVGEDEAGRLPSRNMLLAGVDTDLPAEQGRVRFFAEWVDLLAGRLGSDPRPGVTYRHSAFEQGYTQDGFVLGHPLGGDVRMVTIGTLVDRGRWSLLVAGGLGHAEPTARWFGAGRVLGLDAALRLQLPDGSRLGASAAWWRESRGRRRTAQLWWQLPL